MHADPIWIAYSRPLDSPIPPAFFRFHGLAPVRGSGSRVSSLGVGPRDTRHAPVIEIRCQAFQHPRGAGVQAITRGHGRMNL